MDAPQRSQRRRVSTSTAVEPERITQRPAARNNGGYGAAARRNLLYHRHDDLWDTRRRQAHPRVAAGRDYTGYVTADTDIASVRAGYRRQYVSPGVTFELRGGNLSGATIQAGTSIGTVDVGRLFSGTGSIANATLRAQNGGITSITAGADINATVFGQTSIGSVTAGSASGAGNVAGSIEAGTQTIGSVTANFGSVSASVKAGTSIDTVTATHDITGPVTAGTRIGDLASRTGVHAKAGDITGLVKAGTNIGSVQAGRHVASVEAGGTIGEVVAGALGGGNITGPITAGGDLNRIVALGPWAESARRPVYTSQSLPVGIEWLPGQGKPTHNRRPRPNAIPLAAGDAYGNIQGKLRPPISPTSPPSATSRTTSRRGVRWGRCGRSATSAVTCAPGKAA